MQQQQPQAATTTMTAADAQDDWQDFSAIRKEELLDALAVGRVQVVNVLEGRGGGAKGLILGSRHIPLSHLDERLGELDRGRDVVVYCANYECPLSHEAARLLVHRGFHVRVYRGGIEEWVEAGLPTAAAVEVKKEPAEEQKKEPEKKEAEAKKEPAEPAEAKSDDVKKEPDDVKKEPDDAKKEPAEAKKEP